MSSFPAAAPAPRHALATDPARPKSPAALLRASLVKDLRWLLRIPSIAAGLALVIVANNLGLWVASAVVEASVRLGLVAFCAGGVLVIGLASLLELERQALGDWVALPRSLSGAFARKALLTTALATAGTLPGVLYTVLLAGAGAGGLLLLYAWACIAVLAFLQTGIWLRGVRPHASASPLAALSRVCKLLLVAGILSTAFASGVTLASSVQLLLLMVGFAIAFWQGSIERVLCALDPDAPQPAMLTSTFAIVLLVVMGWVKFKVQDLLIRDGSPPARAIAFAVAVAGLVLGSSLLWLRLRGVSNLRERLGLTRGRGWSVILREAALWSVPAIAIQLAYVWAFGHQFSVLLEQPVAQQPTGVLLATASTLTLVSVLCIAGPVLEELTYRGMLYRSLRSGYAVPLSVLVTSLVFVADHTLLSAVPLFCAAVCMALACERSRSLYAAMLVHAAYNAIVVVQLLIPR